MPTELPNLLVALKPALSIICLTAFWSWETCWPLIDGRSRRWRHAVRNISIALLNVVLLNLLFGAVTIGVATWTTRHCVGLLQWLNRFWFCHFIMAILLLDIWLYCWHRLNHTIGLLWQFHRVHHADREMDVTTASRFHLGEHVGSAILRLLVIPLLGLTFTEILAYEAFVVAATMFHHANISLGAIDRRLRWVLVTPRMHQTHHSRLPNESNANYGVLFSFWDRIANTYQVQTGSDPIALGLIEFDDDQSQTITGMLKTPFVSCGGDSKVGRILD